MLLKEKILTECFHVLNEKIKLLQNDLNDLRDSAANETKSTAGDKHETALAMLQIEQENKNRQLRELLSQKLILEQINLAIQPTIVAQGSLIKTNKGYLFISIALGKIKIENITIITLSIESPLGKKLKGSKTNNTVVMNNITYAIESIE